MLNTDELLRNSLLDNFTQNQVLHILESQKKWQWIGYVIPPILLLIKISIITAILQVGCREFAFKLSL